MAMLPLAETVAISWAHLCAQAQALNYAAKLPSVIAVYVFSHNNLFFSEFHLPERILASLHISLSSHSQTTWKGEGSKKV